MRAVVMRPHAEDNYYFVLPEIAVGEVIAFDAQQRSPASGEVLDIVQIGSEYAILAPNDLYKGCLTPPFELMPGLADSYPGTYSLAYICQNAGMKRYLFMVGTVNSTFAGTYDVTITRGGLVDSSSVRVAPNTIASENLPEAGDRVLLHQRLNELIIVGIWKDEPEPEPVFIERYGMSAFGGAGGTNPIYVSRTLEDMAEPGVIASMSYELQLGLGSGLSGPTFAETNRASLKVRRLAGRVLHAPILFNIYRTIAGTEQLISEHVLNDWYDEGGSSTRWIIVVDGATRLSGAFFQDIFIFPPDDTYGTARQFLRVEFIQTYDPSA